MPRILVVDDSLLDRKVAGMLLEKQSDWSVLYAGDGTEAVDQLESHLPDLVVTDLQMPNMNGLELVEAVRDEYPLIPVVLMTGAGSERIAVEAIEKGAASYVPKTELAADLVEIVDRLLATSAERRSRRRLQNYMTEISYVVENDLELLSALVQELRQLIGERWLLEEAACLRFATAVDEALQNAYFHGNLEISSEIRESDADAYRNLAEQRRHEEPFCRRSISVRVLVSKQQVSVNVCDEGPGFDPSQLPDPTAPGFIERPCGRGVFLMRSFADEVRFNETGNEVTLVKRSADQRKMHL